jgi:hypothetical protein
MWWCVRSWADCIMTTGLSRKQPDDIMVCMNYWRVTGWPAWLTRFMKTARSNPLRRSTSPSISVCASRIHKPTIESPDETIEAWHQVYEGCAAEGIAQIEAIALDRSHFMRQEP